MMLLECAAVGDIIGCKGGELGILQRVFFWGGEG